MSELYFDQRWCGEHGIGRFATEVRRRLSGFADLPLSGSPTHPADAIRLALELGRSKAKLFLSPGFNVPAWSRCRVVVTIHDLIHVHFAGERTKAKLAYYRWIQRPVVRRAPITLTVSEFSRQQIVRWYGVDQDRVISVGNGVSEDFFLSGPSAESARPYILYVGNSKPHKNLGVLLRAMGAVVADHEIDLVLVNRPTKAVHREVDACGLSKNVRFLSGLSDQELAKWYRGASGLVLPSYFEGFGLPAVEAMACGCPVIGSDRTSIPEVLGGAGLTFDPNSASELEDHIRSLIDDASLRGELQSRGRIRANDFRWEKVAEKVRSAIKLAAHQS